MTTDTSSRYSAADALKHATSFFALGIPVFPVRIVQEGGKWNKRPLVDDWVKVAGAPDRFDWSQANGCGLRMGEGWYALDVDIHKEGAAENARAWIDQFPGLRNTRQHSTISGGFHLFFKLTSPWENLRTRANIVRGLDSRGAGGFVAFGEGYRIIRDVPPLILPLKACAMLDAAGPTTVKGRHSGVIISHSRDLTELERRDVMARLRVTYATARSGFRAAWHGVGEQKDKSRSGHDFNVAWWLAQYGFTFNEIVHVLNHEFKHGKSGQSGVTPEVVRWSERAAIKALDYIEGLFADYGGAAGDLPADLADSLADDIALTGVKS